MLQFLLGPSHQDVVIRPNNSTTWRTAVKTHGKQVILRIHHLLPPSRETVIVDSHYACSIDLRRVEKHFKCKVKLM